MTAVKKTVEELGGWRAGPSVGDGCLFGDKTIPMFDRCGVPWRYLGDIDEHRRIGLAPSIEVPVNTGVLFNLLTVSKRSPYNGNTNYDVEAWFRFLEEHFRHSAVEIDAFITVQRLLEAA